MFHADITPAKQAAKPKEAEGASSTKEEDVAVVAEPEQADAA